MRRGSKGKEINLKNEKITIIELPKKYIAVVVESTSCLVVLILIILPFTFPQKIIQTHPHLKRHVNTRGNVWVIITIK